MSAFPVLVIFHCRKIKPKQVESQPFITITCGRICETEVTVPIQVGKFATDGTGILTFGVVQGILILLPMDDTHWEKVGSSGIASNKMIDTLVTKKNIRFMSNRFRIKNEF